MQGIKIKPLAWSDDPSSALDCAWIDNFGLYQITDEAVLFVGHELTGTQYPTIAAAKAAAQADYEARIMAALDVQPLTVQDAARWQEVALKIWRIANSTDPEDPEFIAALRAIAEGRE